MLQKALRCNTETDSHWELAVPQKSYRVYNEGQKQSPFNLGEPLGVPANLRQQRAPAAS